MKLALSCCGDVDGSERIADVRITQVKIGKLYDRIANVYDIWGYLTESRARNRALELTRIVNGQSIVEVACGTGLAFKEIVKRNPDGNNIGIDLSEGMLNKARKKLAKLSNSNYSLLHGTAFQLPLENGSADIMVNNYMFDLIPYEDMDRIIQEFKRVLKIGGKLVLVNMTASESFSSKIYDVLYNLSPQAMGGCRGVQLANKLMGNGFHIETREYIRQMLFPSEVIIAIK
jgi:ubiquinone/menaquinone biosynthesis C-methylase UbiE